MRAQRRGWLLPHSKILCRRKIPSALAAPLFIDRSCCSFYRTEAVHSPLDACRATPACQEGTGRWRAPAKRKITEPPPPAFYRRKLFASPVRARGFAPAGRVRAIIPAAFVVFYPQLQSLNIMHLATPQSAILSAIIFNALIIVALIPLSLRGVAYRPVGAASILRRNLLVYGLGGIIVPFIGIKLIDLVVGAIHLA
jgi:hypothetical protein